MNPCKYSRSKGHRVRIGHSFMTYDARESQKEAQQRSSVREAVLFFCGHIEIPEFFADVIYCRPQGKTHLEDDRGRRENGFFQNRTTSWQLGD